MKIYVIEKNSFLDDGTREVPEEVCEIVEEAGAFENANDAFNAIFPILEKDVKEVTDGCDYAVVSDMKSVNVEGDRHVEVRVEDGYRYDVQEFYYRVVELELNRKEV